MSDHRLYQTIAAQLRKAIESGEFPVGARLPGERDLAERFGVSRVTIREAEIALETQGWIVIRTGSGVYVRARDPAPSTSLPDVSAFELTTARAVIEGEAAALATAHVTDADLIELKRWIDAMSDPAASCDDAAEADRQFHFTIARIAGNPVIDHCVQTIWRMRTEVPRVNEVYARVCHHDTSARADEHGAILEALRRRDAAAARQAMRDHFHRLFEAMLAAAELEALAEARRSTEQNRAKFLATKRI